jgi:hypothetical protein
MSNNLGFGITYILIGVLILIIKDRFYIFKQDKYDIFIRLYIGVLALLIGLWILFISNINNDFVIWVNTHYYYIGILSVIILAVSLALKISNILNAKKK